jgi:hypothetical protein
VRILTELFARRRYYGSAEVAMPGKKAHKPRTSTVKNAGSKGIHAKAGGGKASASQTMGDRERDPKRRIGQFGGAGDPPLMKK